MVSEYIKAKIESNPLLKFILIETYEIIMGLFGMVYRFKWLFKVKMPLSVKVTGWRSVYIGRNCTVCHDTWINVNKRTSNKCVYINDSTLIGSNNFLTVGKEISFGCYCLTASNCSFIGSSHIASDVMKPYISTGVTDDAVINIGHNCFFGFGSSVIGNVNIGHGSIIGANTVVTKSVPPFSIVVGNPAKVIKRFDFESGLWTNKLDDIDLTFYPSESDYLDSLKANKSVILPSIIRKRYLSSIY